MGPKVTQNFLYLRPGGLNFRNLLYRPQFLKFSLSFPPGDFFRIILKNRAKVRRTTTQILRETFTKKLEKYPPEKQHFDKTSKILLKIAGIFSKTNTFNWIL